MDENEGKHEDCDYSKQQAAQSRTSVDGTTILGVMTL